MLGFVGQVRPTIFHLRDLRIGIPRMFPVLVRGFLLALAVQARQVLTRRRRDSRRLRGGRRHFVDVIAERDGKRFLVSLKWQQVSGTAEQKVPFEVISLADAVNKNGFTKAYLVLGGEG
jgi:hypothetical protein